MNEKTKAGVEATIELMKGFVRPGAVFFLTIIIGIMTVQGSIDTIPWQFWAIYSGFAGEWIGERAVKRLVEIKRNGVK